MTRKYELKRRAERQAETRERIVQATVDLHTTVGPARTSVSAIAERAGVQRHTVYAHFPSERELFVACTAHWSKDHPFPDPLGGWRSTAPSSSRAALHDVYTWYEHVEAMSRSSSATRGARARRRELRSEPVDGASARALAQGWPRRKAVRAAIGHALEFETWRSLVRVARA